MPPFLKPGVYGPTGHNGEVGLPGYTSGFVTVANFILRPLGFTIICGSHLMWGPKICFLARHKSYPPVTPSSYPQPK